MASIFITRRIPESGIAMLREAGHEVDVSEKDGVLTKHELIEALGAKPYEAIVCLLTDSIDGEVLDAAPNAKICANYAVGYNNIDLAAAAQHNVLVTNTPDVLTDTVAEHTMALMLAIACRIPEADRFVRAGKYDGWAPLLLLGTDLKGKTLGILGAGRIGSTVARMAARGFGMEIAYYDIKQNEALERDVNARFFEEPDALLGEADFVTVHVPLLDSTRHLINKERLGKMKPGAYLMNASRGPVIDEAALVEALSKKYIKGAALDVYEEEPALAEGLAKLDNVVLTPHIASATEETRGAMSEIAAKNVLAALAGEEPENLVKAKPAA